MNWALIALLFDAGWRASALAHRVARGRARGMTVRESIMPERAKRAPRVTEVV